jgi:hypothetical protein
MPFYTKAGSRFGLAMTEWLQDTRLMSEAVFRLYSEHKKKGLIDFSPASWPKPQKADLPLHAFEIKPVPLAQRMDGLLKTLWRSQFIFLESLWEEYLQDLVLELRHKDASVFEPFCEQKFMAGIVRDVLAGALDSVDEIKDEAAARFAAGITRQPWRDQWAQLARLEVGLAKSDEGQSWFAQLDVYFEMRNCIVHRQGRVSSLLNQKTDYFSKKKIEQIEIWSQHLDFYRRRFLDCVGYIEAKIEAKFKGKDGAKSMHR